MSGDDCCNNNMDGNAAADFTAAVVIPCFNSEKTVDRAIQSVLDQVCPNLEIIVVDDGSTDGSLDVVRSFGDRIKILTGPNRGACAARNAGLASASTEWVLFLDSDDYVMPDSLSVWLQDADGADIVIGPFAYGNEGELRRAAGMPRNADAQSVLNAWLSGWFTPPCAILWRREFVEKIGGWQAGLPRNQDGELVMRAMIEGARVAISERGLGVYVQHDSATRISRSTGRHVVQSEFDVFCALLVMAEAHGLDNARKEFAKAFYRVAYQAFSHGFNDLGTRALAKSRELGLRGHNGSPAHVFLSNILGLRNKLRLTDYLRGRRTAFRSSARL